MSVTPYRQVGYPMNVNLRRTSMLHLQPALRRTAALLIVGVIAAAVVTMPAWCVATGLWR